MADSYSLKAILSAVDNLSPVLKSVQGVAKNTRKYLGDVGGSISSLAGKIGVPTALISGLAAGLGALAIKKYVTDFAAFSEGVIKSAFAMGASNDQAQRMKYVFEQAGLPIESAQVSMGKLNKNLGAAGSGKNKDLEQLLKRLGVPLRGVNGQIRNAADMLPELADAFVKNQDPIKQAAIGNALFGKSYADMLPFLNEGSEGIKKSLDRYKQLAEAVGDTDLQSAKAFGDQLQDLGFIGQNFQRMIARELVPVLGPLIEKLIQWVAANKGLISSQISKAVKELVAAISSVDWPAFIKGVRDTVAWIGRMIDNVGGAKNALIALFVLMNVQSIVAIVGLIASLGRLGLALVGVSAQALVASKSLAFFAASQAGIGAALTGSLAGAAKSAGLLAAAALVGYAIGSVIYKSIEDMPIADWIGSIPTRIAAMFGNADAQRTLDNNAAAERMFAKPPGVVAAAGAVGRMPATPAAPGGLGSGSFNLAAPAKASLNGKLEFDFKNAPPGMMVNQVRTDSPGLALNTNVGYRSLGATGAF